MREEKQNLIAIKEIMKSIFLVTLFTLFMSGCAVASLTSAVLSTTVAVVTLPIKAVGAVVEAVTPGDEDEDDEEDSD